MSEFVHSMTTAMPEPPKGRSKDPPVRTMTIFKVVKQSGKIQMSYGKIGEDDANIGSDVVLFTIQRPNVVSDDDGFVAPLPKANSISFMDHLKLLILAQINPLIVTRLS